MRADIEAMHVARSIFRAATPILKIVGMGGRLWKRGVAKGSRIGPWREAYYNVLDEKAWKHREACLYLVGGSDEIIRYVGISRNRLADRWRISPAYDALTMRPLPDKQLFHSQCWKHLESETRQMPQITYEVRAITGTDLVSFLEALTHPISAFATLKDDGESVVAAVERWLCNRSSPELVSWNVAMTGR